MEIHRSLRTEFIDTPTAKQAVLFANSPAYLLNRLRKDSSVSYVASILGTGEIIERLAAFCARPPKDPIDLVRIYVLLIALSRKTT